MEGSILLTSPDAEEALRHAVCAAKQDFVIRMKEKPAKVETRYLQD